MPTETGGPDSMHAEAAPQADSIAETAAETAAESTPNDAAEQIDDVDEVEVGLDDGEELAAETIPGNGAVAATAESSGAGSAQNSDGPAQWRSRSEERGALAEAAADEDPATATAGEQLSDPELGGPEEEAKARDELAARHGKLADSISDLKTGYDSAAKVSGAGQIEIPGMTARPSQTQAVVGHRDGSNIPGQSAAADAQSPIDAAAHVATTAVVAGRLVYEKWKERRKDAE